MKRKLTFLNSDAATRGGQEITVTVSTKSIKPIMAWYGAYHAGDRYKVLVDGTKVKKDQNGELVGDLP